MNRVNSLNQELDKEKLKKKFIRGNKKAFDIIYSDYSQAMYSICLRYTKNQDEAADIMQDAFIKVYEKRKLFNPEYEIGAWIKRIVINEAINHYRVNKKFDFIEDDNYFEMEDEVIEVVNEENIKNVLNQVLTELPDGYKAVFNMFVLDNLSHKEIADYLGISVNTSKTQLLKARKMIRTKLEERNITRSNITDEQGV